MNISPLHRVLVLLFVLLGLYYSAIFNPVNLIDDSQILRLFEWDGSGGLRSFLLPGESFYYRPFLMFTFYLDFVLWNNQPSFLHLENILFCLASPIPLFHHEIFDKLDLLLHKE